MISDDDLNDLMAAAQLGELHGQMDEVLGQVAALASRGRQVKALNRNGRIGRRPAASMEWLLEEMAETARILGGGELPADLQPHTGSTR